MRGGLTAFSSEDRDESERYKTGGFVGVNRTTERENDVSQEMESRQDEVSRLEGSIRYFRIGWDSPPRQDARGRTRSQRA